MIETRDAIALEAFFRRDPALHLYELGDLDPFFWPRCTWYALREGEGEWAAVLLVYAGARIPTVLALGREDDVGIAELFERALPYLPDRFYAHLRPGLERILGDRPRTGHGTHLKMVLRHQDALARVDVTGVEPLSPEDLAALEALYARAYPSNWFDARMLETGRYWGLRDADRLVAAAGVHVYAPSTSVAAVGNVATDPEYRCRGLARRVTSRLCRELSRDCDTIGLNVHADNSPAIACYHRLGFRPVATYEEWMVDR